MAGIGTEADVHGADDKIFGGSGEDQPFGGGGDDDLGAERGLITLTASREATFSLAAEESTSLYCQRRLVRMGISIQEPIRSKVTLAMRPATPRPMITRPISCRLMAPTVMTRF
ncbi:MAG: hypothetical protein R3C05_12290 [Pirellulaceae bacterium]